MIASMLKLSLIDCKKQDVKDMYSLHRIVYSLFPKMEGENRDFLFADKGMVNNRRCVLILSQRMPLKPEFGELETKEIPDTYLDYQRYGFEIIINPVIRNGQSRKAIPIRDRAKLREWFVKKAPTHGFEVEPATLEVRKTCVQQFGKTRDKEIFEHTHGSATFVGKLFVKDRNRFKESFRRGIGRAKGFGFGLLQIVPI